jgi:ferredoxin-NADP reductase
VALTVERLDDGEVSPYLVDELRRGDGLAWISCPWKELPLWKYS